MYKVAIIISSDSCYKGQRQDASGSVITDIIKNHNLSLYEKVILPDNYEKLKTALIKYADIDRVDLILTSGGTGFSLSDITPEATKAVIDREAPGICQAIRTNGAKHTDRAMLSRAVCGIRNSTLILNLPGSPKAVTEDLTFVLPTLLHGLDILSGSARDCARK